MLRAGSPQAGSPSRLLNDEQCYRRLVRTQVEAVLQVLTQMQRAYGDVTPFNRPRIAEFEDEEEGLGPDATRVIGEILSGDN